MKISVLLIILLASILPCCSSGGSSDPAVSSDPAISQPAAESITLTVESNPRNVLSVYVSWTTDNPMDSEVQFGEGSYEFKIHDGAEVTNHRVLVIGMHAETSYLIKAVSSNSKNTLEDESTWTTGALPINVPEGIMLTNNSVLSQDGWTLMNIQVGSGTFASSNEPATAVMYDHDGLPVWYHTHGTTNDIGGGVSTELLDSDTILIGPTNKEPPREVDLAGNIIWEGPEQTETTGNGKSPDLLSHDVSKLSNDNYLLLRLMQDEDGGPTDARLEEVTANNQVVWEWNLYDFITPPEGKTGDWCHANSATVDIENDEVYLNCRWLGLFKTTYNSPKKLQWHMPALYNASELGDVAFIPEESRFMDTHDPEIHNDGTILFFDNGGWNFTQGPGEYHSRILKFAVDEETKEAELVWEFPGDFEDLDPWFYDDFYCPFWGDANRLDNGNVLVTAGVRGEESISHIFEVTYDGEVVWNFTLPKNHGVYRAMRITPPLIVPL